jgi:hypothetical protein
MALFAETSVRMQFITQQAQWSEVNQKYRWSQQCTDSEYKRQQFGNLLKLLEIGRAHV